LRGGRSGRALPPERESDIAGLRHVSETMIYLHVFDNADREVGGVLVGRVGRSGGAPMITGAIPAMKADERRATLTFTQDAWEHVHRTLDRDYPDGDQIVGWYHSHPGFGIFLSEHDLFIHRNFFSGASQIALVIDPQERTEGVFAWDKGHVVPLYHRATPPAWQPRSDGPLELRVPTKPPAYPLAAIAVAAIVGFGFGFGIWRVAFQDETGRSPAKTPAPPANKDTTTNPAGGQKTNGSR
jgi:proteasome lid subunit RPN8/RPN11